MDRAGARTATGLGDNPGNRMEVKEMLDLTSGKRWLATPTRAVTSAFARERPDARALLPAPEGMARTKMAWVSHNFQPARGAIHSRMELIDGKSTLHNAQGACEVLREITADAMAFAIRTSGNYKLEQFIAVSLDEASFTQPMMGADPQEFWRADALAIRLESNLAPRWICTDGRPHGR